MASRQHYPESSYQAYEDFDIPRPHSSIVNFQPDCHPSFELYAPQHSVPSDSMPTTTPVQYAVGRNPGVPAVPPIIRPAVPPFLPVPQDNGALVGADVLETFSFQPHVSTLTSRPMKVPHLNVFQVTHPSYAGNVAQAFNMCAAIGYKDDQDELQTHQPVSRKLAPQEIYKTARQQAGFRSAGVIEFAVDGKEGIRLSDALEGNWKGFEGRDDRSLFECDRHQILLRLHVSGSACMHH
jgi:hypothetical protein